MQPEQLTGIDGQASAVFVHTNYRMAAARIGIALVLVPLLWGIAVLLYLDSPPNALVSVVLLLLGLPLVWYALSVPTSLRLGNVLTVYYLFRKRTLPLSRVRPATFTTLRRNFTLGQMLTSRHLPAAHIPMARIVTGEGRDILVRSTLDEVQEFNHQLQLARTSAGQPPA